MEIEFFPITEAAKLYPPKPIKFDLPSWYKNLSSYVDNFSSKEDYLINKLGSNEAKNNTPFTIKKCIPVLDYLTSGYMFYTCSDLFVSQNIDEELNINGFDWQTPSNISGLVDARSSHHHSQCPIHIGGSKHHYIKLGISWKIKTPPGYSCMIYQPFYNFEDKIKLFPAIIDTDTFDTKFNIPGYVNSPEPFFVESWISFGSSFSF